MSIQLVQRSNAFVGSSGIEVAPVAGWTTALSATIRRWAARRDQRKALGELAELNPHLLKDIGVSRNDAMREAARWFWQTGGSR